jgi:hypothetical protein
MSLSKVTYSFLNIMADVGGSFALIFLFFQALIYQIAQHSFLVQFLNRLYLAKALKDRIF